MSEQAARDWFQKGEAFQKQGHLEKAAAAYRQVIALKPDLPSGWINLGLALHHLHRIAEAEAALLQALRLSPGNVPALNLLASNYAMSGNTLRAIAAWRQITVTNPDHFAAWANLAKAFSALHRYGESIAAYEQALRLRPEHAELLMELLHMLCRLCRWDRANDVMAQLPDALRAQPQWMQPFMVCVHKPEWQLDNAKRYAATFFPSGKAYNPAQPLPADGRGDRRLRIGYLSSDFHTHATAHLISELFERHDRQRFEIIAYSCGKDEASAERSRIRNSVDHFHDLQMIDDLAAAHRIREDGIDILVDLKGYTTGPRLGIMAQRPAPLQMHYLGYPGTVGAAFIDYYIADAIAAPAGADADFSECLIRLPHSYQINDRKRPLPAAGKPRTEYGLPPEGFVFCDFNSSYKITPEIFAVWMRLLAAVPGSVLWIYETHAEATDNLRKEAAKQGIDPARIIAAGFAPLEEHLARYRHADLVVDTFPYNGHTTTSDALWCGVPVVTLAGKHFVSRVAASLLHAAELPELVKSNPADYEALALSLATDKQKLDRLRRPLEEKRMQLPLFDSAATTCAIEAAYLHAAERHRNGLAPHPFSLDDIK